MNASVFVTGTAAMMTMGISPALHMASMALHVSVGASRRGYLNYQHNKYLDVMNEAFFKPRGLYCMVIKYEPYSNDVFQTIDLESNVQKRIDTVNQDQTSNSFKNFTRVMASYKDRRAAAKFAAEEPN
ncbi:Hypothetical protein D9617_3g022300 [Elsinoe fawcettii]|nr:Hypothetical protein D9617_3g022300 [Elsinoe fawcettii]